MKSKISAVDRSMLPGRSCMFCGGEGCEFCITKAVYPKWFSGRGTSKRQAGLVLRGMHPFGNRLLKPNHENASTCGNCKHRIKTLHHGKKYNKCKHYGITNSETTDLRIKWFACAQWEGVSVEKIFGKEISA